MKASGWGPAELWDHGWGGRKGMKTLISAQPVPGTDVSTSSMEPNASSPDVCGQSLSSCVG